MDLPVIASLVYICIMLGGCLAALSIVTRQRQRAVRVIAAGKPAQRLRDI